MRAFHYDNELEIHENRQLKGTMENRSEVSVATLRVYEKINNDVKGGNMRSVASLKIPNYSGKKRYYQAHHHIPYNESKRRILVGSSTSSDSHQSKINRNMMSLTS